MFCEKCGSVCNDFLEGNTLRKKCSKCGNIIYKNPYPCIAVLVEDAKGRILLGRRASNSLIPGKWCLPCGYIDYDESFINAAIREAKEETGVDIEPKSIINVISNIYSNGVNSLVIVIYAIAKNGRILAGDDIVEARWFDINTELPDLAFSADKHLLEKFITLTKGGNKFEGIPLDGSFFNVLINKI